MFSYRKADDAKKEFKKYDNIKGWHNNYNIEKDEKNMSIVEVH